MGDFGIDWDTGREISPPCDRCSNSGIAHQLIEGTDVARFCECAFGQVMRYRWEQDVKAAEELPVIQDEEEEQAA